MQEKWLLLGIIDYLAQQNWNYKQNLNYINNKKMTFVFTAIYSYFRYQFFNALKFGNKSSL